MAVTSFKERPLERTYTADTAGFNRRAVRKFTATIESADKTDGAAIVYRYACNTYSPTLKPHFGVYPSDAFMKSVSIEVEPLTELTFDVTVNYQSYYLAAQDTPDPEQYAPEVNWASVVYTDTIDRDVRGKALVNAAGQLYENRTIEVCDPVCTVTRKEKNFSADTIRNYHGTVNLATFAGAPPYCARITDIRARRMEPPLIEYWTVTYQIQFKMAPDPITGVYNGWKLRLPNVGLYVKDSTGKITRLRDAQGVEFNEPQPLNPTGTSRLPDWANTEWYLFDIYRAVDWAPLGLE